MVSQRARCIGIISHIERSIIRKVVQSDMLVSYILSFFLTPTINPIVALPRPPGPTNVHITQFALTDESRTDPFAPCCDKPRQLMVSLFQPANCTQTIDTPYMPPATAAFYDAQLAVFGIPNGTFEAFHLQTCPNSPANTDFPLLLFSTGAGNSRHLYNTILQWVASTGFNIVSIDHTYDADIVEFPDGTVALGANISLPANMSTTISVRLADVSFVLDTLSNTTSTKLLDLPALRTKQVGMFGHSLGGATAADAMLNETRIRGGVNMDGTVYGAAVNETDRQPFVIFASQQHNQSTDATWAAFWLELKGFKLQLQVNGTAHGSYVDYPILAKVAGLNRKTNPAIEALIGSIDGTTILRILQRYINAFFQQVLEFRQLPLLQGPSLHFPEVLFQNASYGPTAEPALMSQRMEVYVD
ncbi:PAF acetylhydrolase family protein [Exophiala viscosa]|uniref:1-alkyl-2-acetylglycerophosphocholine esterase n=1 Tax=Exophiala viscosa TaxID=2486360 RepID=A0AAN6E8F3_9EURO|nr:PAF acetylhydrolase family protein [Exophiala viscosa]KAI1628081.1 PAF acetylhydrolase family protein [Exophiala viscosa]